jgi:tetratricopeptide (TPR) repeat protein
MLRERESPANRALIDAMAKRYVAEPPEDRASLDAAWADAMRDAYRRFPRDADIGALFAEALLDQHPWWTWTKDGQPMYGTEEAILALEATLEHAPLHPQANHLYIHAVEASPRPERGIPSAERLGELLPAAGHLVHMPAHIWINLGRYEAAENANHRAVAADRAYLRRSGPQGIYEFYRAHNHHFLVYAAMFAGRRELALRAARNLVAEIPDAMKRDMPGLVDGFLAVPLHALLRFGRYDDVLREPQFGEAFPIARALWHYARGIAFAAKGRIAEAGAEQRAFTAAAELVTEDAAIGINAARPVIEVARAMLEGELLYRKGRTDDGFAALRRAVELEDALRYDEPSPWMQPVRHALGALLHEQGRHAEAAEVFRQDLRIHRENGWALHGLAACLRASGEAVAARGVEARLAQAWARADTKIAAACYCSRAAGASAPLDADGKSTGGACR